MEDATRRSLANCRNVCLCSKPGTLELSLFEVCTLEWSANQAFAAAVRLSYAVETERCPWCLHTQPAVSPLPCSDLGLAHGQARLPGVPWCCNPPWKPRLIFLGQEQIGAKLSTWFSALSTSIGQRPGVKPVGQSSKLSCWSQGSACCLLMGWATGQGVNDSGFGFLMSIQTSLALLGYSCLHFPEGVGAESRTGEFPCASRKTAGFLLWSQTHWKACYKAWRNLGGECWNTGFVCFLLFHC